MKLLVVTPMSERLDNQKKSINNIHQLLQERIEKANLRRTLTVDEAKRLTKLEAIADKLRREENVQTVSSKRGLVKISTNN